MSGTLWNIHDSKSANKTPGISARSISLKDLKILAHTVPKEDISRELFAVHAVHFGRRTTRLSFTGDSKYE